METVEVVGFLVFTIAAAGLIIAFLYNINFGEIQNTMTSIITPKEVNYDKLQKVNYVELIKRIQSCNEDGVKSGETVDCGNLLLTAEDLEELQLMGLNKLFFENKFDEFSYCADCNIDVNGLIMPNTVIHLSYDTNLGQVKLQGTFTLPSDNLPPVTALKGCEGGNANSNQIITLTCTDAYPGTGCKETKYIVDTGIEQTGKSINLIQLIAEHTYTIKYYSVDNNNNLETKKTFSCKMSAKPVTPDVIPPVTAFMGCSSNIWNTASTSISLRCFDSESGCKTDSNAITYRYYNKNEATPPAWSTATKQTSFNIDQTTADTNYRIDYYSVDNAENVEVIKTNYCPIRKIYVPPAVCFSKGGSGSELYPYKISTCYDLNCIRDKTGDNNYILVNDIDCSETETWNDGNGFLQIYQLSSKSVINGANYKITNFYQHANSSTSSAGLFTYNYGQIKNLTFENATIKTDYMWGYLGIFSGVNYGTITNCTTTGNFYDYGYYSGGITGYNYGTITNTLSDINLIKKINGSSAYYSAGIAGYNSSDGKITQTTANIKIDTNNSIYYFGGIVGENAGTITNATSKITQDSNINFSSLGGISYSNSGTITNSTSEINLLQNSTNISSNFGGISTSNSGTIQSSTAKITQSNIKTNIGTFGGISTSNSGTIKQTTTNITQDGNLTISSFGGITGDNSGTIQNSTAKITQITQNSQANYFGGISASNSGTIDQTISEINLTQNTSNSSYVGGLAGYNSGAGIIKNSKTNFIVTTENINTYYFGGIVGRNFGGIIKQISSETNLTQNKGTISMIGGVTGYNDSAAIITQTKTNLIVHQTSASASNSYFGGAAGYNSGQISNSYVFGSVDSLINSPKAGFVGYHNDSNILNSFTTLKIEGVNDTNQTGHGFCYNKSKDINNSFWDITATTRTTSNGGIGKTTPDMKTKLTFTNANWSEDIWTLCDGSYPSLKWEGTNCDGAPAPLITISGISTTKTSTPQLISAACTIPAGCEKIEYQIGNGAWISNLNTLTNNPVGADSNIKITFKATSNSGVVETSTLYSAVAGQSILNSSLVMSGTSLGGGASTSIIGGGNGYAITNFSAGSNFSGFNSPSVIPGSCEFMIDDSQVWLEGVLNWSGCFMKPLNISKNDSLDFIIKLRAKDTSGNYIQGPRIKAVINTTGGALINLTQLS